MPSKSPSLLSVPTHVAIIMDGNGRWAKNQKKQRLFGHTAGVESARNVIEASIEHGVKYLTLYAFSTENWNRPQDEVNGLMSLLLTKIKTELKQFIKNGIRLNVIGDRDRLPKNVRKALEDSMEATKDFDKLMLNVALSYSSKWEIAHALKMIAKEVQQGKLHTENINEHTLDQYLQTQNQPDPELLIRTGGEKRISNFLLYQLAYTELYFTDIFWPEFDKKEFAKALDFYRTRQRRFGKTGEQISEESSHS